MPQMSQVLRERAIGMLTAGMSTRPVACELNVNFSTISHFQRRFREYGSTSNRSQNRRPCVTTPAQDLHIQHLHLQDRLRPATRTAAATIDLHYQRISAQTVRNRLREAHLHARRLFLFGSQRRWSLSLLVLTLIFPALLPCLVRDSLCTALQTKILWINWSLNAIDTIETWVSGNLTALTERSQPAI